MRFNCTSRRQGDTVVVTPSGDVDRDTAGRLREVLADAARQPGVGRIEVDLADVGFMDSSGIGALLAGHRQAGAAGADFRVRDPRPTVRTVIDITNVGGLLGI